MHCPSSPPGVHNIYFSHGTRLIAFARCSIRVSATIIPSVSSPRCRGGERWRLASWAKYLAEVAKCQWAGRRHFHRPVNRSHFPRACDPACVYPRPSNRFFGYRAFPLISLYPNPNPDPHLGLYKLNGKHPHSQTTPWIKFGRPGAVNLNRRFSFF